MIPLKIPGSPTGVEHDSRLFTWLLTLVMATMYSVSLVNTPTLRQPLRLALFTALFIVHVGLHWQIEKIFTKPKLSAAYVLTQGMIGFAICSMVAYETMIFAIYFALIGEAAGMFGLTRRTLLAVTYYLALAFIKIQPAINTISLSTLAFTAIPSIIFVVIYVTLYNRQSEARAQAQTLAARLEAANRQLSEYAAQVEDLTIAAERQRLARELHDTLSQGLAGLILQLEAADIHLSHNRHEKARQIIAQAMQKARESLASARRVINNLREETSGELEDTLRREINRFEAATDIPCAFHAAQTPPLPDSVKEALLRTISEALTNIASHAQASEASVTLAVHNTPSAAGNGEAKTQTLTLAITDNGIGFDPEKIPAGHYGILGIRERIRLINGQFTLESAPGKGATLSVQIPIEVKTSGASPEEDPHPRPFSRSREKGETEPDRGETSL